VGLSTQQTLGAFGAVIPPKPDKPPPIDLPPTYPQGFRFDCETCWLFRGYQFQTINGQEIRSSKCSFRTRIYEKHCRGRLWLDPDESKRYWIPKPLIQAHEVKKYRLKDERRKKAIPGIPDEEIEDE